MRLTLSPFLLFILACSRPAGPSLPDDSQPGPSSPDAGAVEDAGAPPPPNCGELTCTAEQACVARPAAPGAEACVPAGDCRVVPLQGRDLVAELLDAGSWDRCSAVPQPFLPAFPGDIPADPFRLSFVDGLLNRPLGLMGFSNRLVDALPAASAPRAVTRTVEQLSAKLDHPLLEAPLASPAPADVAKAAAELLGDGSPAVRAELAKLPVEVLAAWLPILESMQNVRTLRAVLFAGQDIPMLARLAGSVVVPDPQLGMFNFANNRVRTGLAGPVEQGGLDWTSWFQACRDVVDAVEQAHLERFAGLALPDVDLATPAGRVVFHGPGAHLVEGAAPAVLFDTGGADTYRAPVGAADGAVLSAAVAVDLGGDDAYGYPEVPVATDTGNRLPSDGAGRYAEGDAAQGQTAVTRSTTPRQGAGRLGVGVLWDVSGNDSYRSLAASQGYGAMGVGVLFDGAGNDTYALEVGGQGTGTFGIGLLRDVSGNDTYKSWSMAQGHGSISGAGALLDDAGDDAYLADVGDPARGGDPLYFTVQMKGTGNNSMVQGAGRGIRGNSQASGAAGGGIGLLVDRGAGKDRYLASVFARGTGYWFGLGVFDDDGGDDQYDGLYYVDGATAHFALSTFRDRGGNDQHGNDTWRPVGTSVAIGHDFSVSFLWDDAGDDVYRAPGLGLGAGNANGWGLLVDLAGNDTYDAPGGNALAAFGETNQDSFRAGRPTVGVVLDAAGDDTWIKGTETLVPPVDGALRNPVGTASPQARGLWMDADGGVVLFVP
ncbi:MAG: hypothetical protein FJ086_06015 [Deltaproteobacteria bacterium]|nr:hypothetical protein [Deltaproteobacteria bacterium]